MKRTFLGKEAEFPSRSVLLASRFDVPVSFVFAMKESSLHIISSQVNHIIFLLQIKENQDLLLNEFVRQLPENESESLSDTVVQLL